MLSSIVHRLADLSVTAEDGTIQLLIETKHQYQVDSLEAAQAIWQRVMDRHADSYFLFISTRKFWLWLPGATEASYQGETDQLLRRYVNLNKVPLATLGGREFTLLVYSWLGSIIFKPASTLLTIPGQEWLVTTGLHSHIYRGFIHLEADAS
jgi:hypothetical protein